MPYGTFGALIEIVDDHGLKHWRRPQTKKELKEAVAADPKRVIIVEDLSLLDSGTPGGQALFTTDQIAPGTFYGAIHGPDPQRKRVWIAKIERTNDGKLKVT